MSLKSIRLEVREQRAAGATIAALAKDHALPRRLVSGWCRDILVEPQANTKKQQALDLYATGTVSKKAIARQLGVAVTTVRGWLDSEWDERRKQRNHRSQLARSS